MEMHKRKRMKNKLTKNIFRSTLYNFRADLFLIWRGFRARRKHRLASLSFRRCSCQNCVNKWHRSWHENPWISFHPKQASVRFKARWPTAVERVPDGKCNFNRIAHRITYSSVSVIQISSSLVLWLLYIVLS